MDRERKERIANQSMDAGHDKQSHKHEKSKYRSIMICFSEDTKRSKARDRLIDTHTEQGKKITRHDKLIHHRHIRRRYKETEGKKQTNRYINRKKEKNSNHSTKARHNTQKSQKTHQQ